MERTFTPVDVPKEAVARVHTYLGFSRAVVVQSTCHGTDHAALIDALAADPRNLRGVALVKPSTPREEIERLHAAGVRGFRLNYLPHLGAAPEPAYAYAIAEAVSDLGWHAEVHVAGDGALRHRAVMAAMPCPVVIDHMGRVDLSYGLNSPPVNAMRELLETGKVWVKLSGVDRLSKQGPPYSDAVSLASQLARHAPTRVLWGTDFPHPNIVGEAPDDGLLTDLIGQIAPDMRKRQSLLVDNPAELFGFPATTREE